MGMAIKHIVIVFFISGIARKGQHEYCPCGMTDVRNLHGKQEEDWQSGRRTVEGSVPCSCAVILRNDHTA